MEILENQWYKVNENEFNSFVKDVIKDVNNRFTYKSHIIDSDSYNRIIHGFSEKHNYLYIQYKVEKLKKKILLFYRSNYNSFYMTAKVIDYKPTNIVEQSTKLVVVDDDVLDEWLDKDTQKYLDKRRDNLSDNILYSIRSRFNKENKENKGDITDMLKLVNIYYDNKTQAIQKKCDKEKELILTNNLVYKKAKEFTDFINQFNAAQNCISNLKPYDFINAYNYLTISERKDLQTIDDTTTVAIKDVETERNTVLTLINSAETFEQKLDILNRYNILILPKKNK